ncbi:MAG: PAS domain S-box protein [Candidatus Heimdallarchaeota archaeon]|nr:PAS domain S-box protein [Candidatus Heimdallarchaeota archaeon]
MIIDEMREMFDHLGDGVTLVKNGKIVYVNNQLTTILGYSLEELMVDSTFLFASKEEIEHSEHLDKEVKKNGYPVRTLEYWVIRKDGTRRNIRNLYHNVINEGKITGQIIYTQDITDDKQKETHILASEFKKSKFLDFLSEHIIFHDKNLKIIWANRAASDSLELTTGDLIGKHCYKLWHKRNEPCEICPVLIAKETGQENSAEITTPDGRSWNIRGFPVYGDDGSLIGMAELTREITERKIAEKELKENEERYRHIFHGVVDAIFIHQIDNDGNFGNFIEVNDLACQWTGYSREELMKKTSRDISRRAPIEVERNISKDIMNSGEASFELELISKRNELLPVEIHSTLFSLRGEKVVLSIARDITERKKAEEELRDNEEKFRQIFHKTNDAIFLTKLKDDETTSEFIEVNDVACSWLGYSKNELLTMNSLDITAPVSQSQYQGIIRNIIRKESHSYDSVIVNKDGDELLAEMNSHIFDLKDDKVVVTFARDITERQKAEEELQENEEKFRQIFHNAQDAIFINKVENGTKLGDFIEINNTACQWIGYSRGELLGLTSYESEEKRIEYFFSFHLDEEILTSGKVTFETVIKNRAKKLIPVEVRSLLFELADEKVVLSIARDITERKKAEEIIKESEERYRTLIETSPNAIILISLDAKLQFANKLSAEMFDYETTEEMLGLTPIDFVSRKDFEVATNSIFDTIKTGSVRNVVFDAIKKDGTSFPVELSATLLLDTNDKPRAIMGIIEDITDRKKVVDALKENEEKFRQTFDQSNDGIILYNLKGKIIDVNHRVRELIGYSKSEMLLLTIHQLHPVTEQEDSKEAFEIIQKEGYVKFEINFKRKDGSIFPAEVSSSLFEIGGEKFVQGVIRDITERKKAEKELKESEEKFRQIFHNAHDSILLTGVNRNLGTTTEFIEINDIACKLLGYSKEELLTMKSVDITAPERRESNAEIIREIIINGSGTFETSLITKDGIRIPIELSSHLFMFQDAEVILTIARDISERKKAERDIQESEERYRKLVETSPDGIILTDIGNNILVANLQIAEMYGTQNVDGLIGINSLDMIILEDRDRANTYFMNTLKGGKSGSIELSFLRIDGDSYPGELRATTISDNEGVPFANVCIISDITERKEDDAIKTKAFARIEQNIQDFDALVDRIRNPLTSIIGFAELADSFHSSVIIEEAEKINEITKLIDESWLESEEFRKILRKHLLKEEEEEKKNS